MDRVIAIGAVVLMGLGNACLAQFSLLEIGAVEFSATLDQQLAFNSVNGSTQKFETTFEPRWDVELSDSTRLTAIGRIRLDTEVELGFEGNNSHMDVELREFYFDTELAGAYWRLGKQQIVWGQADGLRVLDVVNPLDFREFILPDFEDQRIPLWTANVEIPLNQDWTAQLLWIPDQTYDRFPQQGESFALTSPLLIPRAPAGVPVTVRQTKKPGRLIKDSDAGMRFTAFLGGWDISLNYLYHYQDQPVLIQQGNADGVVIAPHYERTHLLGGSFSNAFGDFTVRGELGLSSDRFFVANQFADPDGVIHSSEFSYVFGLDYQGWRDWFVSAQIFQSVLTDPAPGLVRDSVDTAATFLLRRDFFNDSLQAELLLIQSMNQADGVVQASLDYEWRSNIRLTLGADIFHGSQQGLFGQFDARDRISLGIEFGY